MTIGLSVVIPTLGKSAGLDSLLKSLAIQNTNFYFEVLVVANLHSEVLREKIEIFHGAEGSPHARIRYLCSGLTGVNRARNCGLKRAQGKIILFLDDDVGVSDRNFLQRHVSRHAEDVTLVGLGGPYVLPKSAKGWARAYHEVSQAWLQKSRMPGQETSRLLGGNMSFKTQALRGRELYFNERIQFGASETELCGRLHQQGLRMVLDESLTVDHHIQLSGFGFLRKAFLQGAGSRLVDAAVLQPERFYASSFLPDGCQANLPIRTRKHFYRVAFEVGAFCDAHREHRSGQRGLKILSYMLSKIQIRRAFHRRWRDFYACLRSSWLENG